MEHRPQDCYRCIRNVDKARPHHGDNHLDLDQCIPEVSVGWDGDVVTLDLVTAVSPGFVPARLEFCVEHSCDGLFCLDI